jgi:hypothetical protein
VKIAVTSSSFAQLLRCGDLTHLEWLEACSSRLGVDGVVFALSDFPRTDGEYAAQVKKVATDLGIVPVALDVPGLLDPDRPEELRRDAVRLATEIGAALIRVTAGPAGSLPPETFARTVAATKALVSAAKLANVTLTVAPGAETVLDDVAALHNFSKYVDSAWLRFDLPPGSSERPLLGPRDRVLIGRVGLDEDPTAIPAPYMRGWLVLEGDGGDDPFTRVGAAAERLARAIIGQQPQMPSVVPG